MGSAQEPPGIVDEVRSAMRAEPTKVRLLTSLNRIAAHEIFRLCGLDDDGRIELDEVADVLDLESRGSDRFWRYFADKFMAAAKPKDGVLSLDETNEIFSQTLSAEGYLECKNILSLQYRKFAEITGPLTAPMSTISVTNGAKKAALSDPAAYVPRGNMTLEPLGQLPPEVVVFASESGRPVAQELRRHWLLEGLGVELVCVDATPERQTYAIEDYEQGERLAAHARLGTVVVLSQHSLASPTVLLGLRTAAHYHTNTVLVHPAADCELPGPNEVPETLRPLIANCPAQPFLDAYARHDAAAVLVALRQATEGRKAISRAATADLEAKGSMTAAREGARFRAFISHLPGTARAQVAFLYSTLRMDHALCVDPEGAEEAADRKQAMGSSASVLLYFSEGCLDNARFCEELAAAVEMRKPLIVMADAAYQLPSSKPWCVEEAAWEQLSAVWPKRIAYNTDHQLPAMTLLRSALSAV